jgi:hypothetical protein
MQSSATLKKVWIALVTIYALKQNYKSCNHFFHSGLTIPSTPPASRARTQPLRGWSGYVGR